MTTRRGAAVLILALVLVSTGRSLGNGFAFDDIPIVLDNPQVQTLAPPWEYAQQSYWPPQNLGDAYRPWTVWWLAIQQAVAGDTAWVFHLVNLVLTAALALAVYALLATLGPRGAALAGAAVFAVHPVHVEATANVVGQAELWMALFTTLGVAVYARSRQRGGAPGPGTRLGIAGLYLLAAAAKEQGLVLPGLLIAFELVRTRPDRDAGLRALAPTYGLLAIVGLGFALGRWIVLGDLGGGPAAAGLDGLGLSGRTAVMAPLMLHWLRLLLWPANLAAQYSPPAFGGSSILTATALAGLTAAAALMATAVVVRRRAPMLSLGIVWAAIGVFPVSNLLFPTGILLAERTLLLPSVGVALAAAGLFALAGRRAEVPPRAPVGTLAAVLAAAVVALVALGAARSWSRQAVWRDNDTLFRQTIIDSPSSYRSHYVYARDLFSRKGLTATDAEHNRELAKRHYAQAASLYGGDRRVFEEWGFILRAEGRCDLAVAVLIRGVRAEPRETLARSRLFECLITLRRYPEAIAVAREGVRLGGSEFQTGLDRAIRLNQDAPSLSSQDVRSH